MRRAACLKPAAVSGGQPRVAQQPPRVQTHRLDSRAASPRAADPAQRPCDRLVAGLLGAAAALALAVVPPVEASERAPFLRSTGAHGPLAEEEAQLLRLRQEYEGEALEGLTQVRAELEREVEREMKDSQASGVSQLCATPFGIDVVGITEFVALTGALVGGISARRRKDELERLNEQLRTINTQLRQQARAGTIFAPGLTYAPTSTTTAGGFGGNGAGGGLAMLPQLQELRPPAPPAPPAAPASSPAPAPPAAASAPAVPAPAISVLSSMDEEENRPEMKQCQAALKEGKAMLKSQQAGPAMVRFEKAHMLAKAMGDRVRERRAVRGLAAASRMTGQGRAAIKHLERVLQISRQLDDYVGDADAYGTIADIYTDLGEFEKAAEYYDKYISRMATDGPV